MIIGEYSPQRRNVLGSRTSALISIKLRTKFLDRQGLLVCQGCAMMPNDFSTSPDNIRLVMCTLIILHCILCAACMQHV